MSVLNTRAARRDLIIQIIRNTAVASQSDLVDMLRERGIEVTQATVSRDLDELGAVKTVAPDGRSLYAVPAEGGEDRLQADELEDLNARLIRVAEDTMVSIAHSGNLVVLRTPPGAAQYLASAFDHSHLQDVIGTIAGDDTILLVVGEHSSGQAVADRLQQLIKNRR
jgi:transcriptional regulator of arginine metabolism